jgi:DNA-binding LacI/PurR family transcriptional regulator
VTEQARGRRIVLLHWQPLKVDALQSRSEVKTIAGELKRNDAAFEEMYIDRLITDNQEALTALEPLFRDGERFDGKVVWCLNRRMLPVVNYLMQKYQVPSPLFGATASVAQANIFPPVPYLLEPYYEMGRTAVELLAGKICSGEPIGNRTLAPSLYCGSVPLQDKRPNRRKSS